MVMNNRKSVMGEHHAIGPRASVQDSLLGGGGVGV